MTRDDVLATLGTHKQVLEERFGVASLALFGSFARDQATDASDIDILVEFGTTPDWKAYFGAVSYLEDISGQAGGLGYYFRGAEGDSPVR